MTKYERPQPVEIVKPYDPSWVLALAGPLDILLSAWAIMLLAPTLVSGVSFAKALVLVVIVRCLLPDRTLWLTRPRRKIR